MTPSKHSFKVMPNFRASKMGKLLIARSLTLSSHDDEDDVEVMKGVRRRKIDMFEEQATAAKIKSKAKKAPPTAATKKAVAKKRTSTKEKDMKVAPKKAAKVSPAKKVVKDAAPKKAKAKAGKVAEPSAGEKVQEEGGGEATRTERGVRS